MEQDELIKRLKEEFEKTKADLGFQSTYEEIEAISFIEDDIAARKYIIPKFHRYLCHRIVDTLNSWNGYLHGIVLPNPASMIAQTESSLFDEEEKKKLMKLMNKIMFQVSKNTVSGLTKDKKEMAELIDSSVKLWNEELNPELQKVMKKIRKYWEKESQ